MGDRQNENTLRWFPIVEDIAPIRPERALEIIANDFVRFVDFILSNKTYDEFPNPEQVRLQDLNSLNKEYKECVSKLNEMIERSDMNETTAIDSIRQKSCEEAS